MGAQVLNATSTETAMANLQKVLASNICETAQTSCTGANTQYASYDACYNFLTSGIIPLGEPYQAGRNTVLCRMIHEPMLVFRPSVHCPHIGPSVCSFSCVCCLCYVLTDFLRVAGCAPTISPTYKRSRLRGHSLQMRHGYHDSYSTSKSPSALVDRSHFRVTRRYNERILMPSFITYTPAPITACLWLILCFFVESPQV